MFFLWHFDQSFARLLELGRPGPNSKASIWICEFWGTPKTRTGWKMSDLLYMNCPNDEGGDISEAPQFPKGMPIFDDSLRGPMQTFHLFQLFRLSMAVPSASRASSSSPPVTWVASIWAKSTRDHPHSPQIYGKIRYIVPSSNPGKGSIPYNL